MEKNYWQCQACGSVHYTDKPYDIEEDIYKEMRCKKCDAKSTHLWAGNKPEDIYIYGNLNLDERYFIY